MSPRQLGWCVVLCALALSPAAATLVRAEPIALAGQADPIQLVALTPAVGGDPGMPPIVSETDCLALNIYWEARSEPRLGQVAVAAVTLNRVADPGFPDTVCGVVRQGEERGRNLCQFSWHCDGLDDRPRNPAAWQHAQRLARLALAGQLPDPTGGALWFHSDQVHPDWTGDMTRIGQIGTHIFYRLAAPIPDRIPTMGPPDLKPPAFASTSDELRPVTAVAAPPVARPLDAAMPAAAVPVAGTDTACGQPAGGPGQPHLAMALATSSDHDLLSLVQELSVRVDRLPCPDEAAADASAPMLVLASDPPGRLDADPFAAILSTGAGLADAGAAIAGSRWTSGPFDSGSGRGGALTPLTHRDLVPIPAMTAAAEPAPRSAEPPIASPDQSALPADTVERPGRWTLAEGVRVAQAAIPHPPALAPAELLRAFEPPARLDRASPPRTF